MSNEEDRLSCLMLMVNKLYIRLTKSIHINGHATPNSAKVVNVKQATETTRFRVNIIALDLIIENI